MWRVYHVDESDAVSAPVPAMELGKDEDRKTTREEVKLVDDCLCMLLGVEKTGYTCEKCGEQVVAHKYVDIFSFIVLDEMLISMVSIDKVSSRRSQKF